MNPYPTTPSNRDTIRKAAILVSALDIDTADALLEQMPDEFASAVRAAVMEIDAIDVREEQEVIGQFLGKRTIGDASDSAVADESGNPAGAMSLEEFLTAHGKTAAGVEEAATDCATQASEPSAPFQSLQSATNNDLFHGLRNEHPQAIALVLSHVSASQAAAVMHRLPARLQVDVARRMVDLDEVDAETLFEIEHGLRQWIDVSQHTSASQTGLKAMQEILAEAPEGGGAILRNLHRSDAEFARQLTGDAATSQAQRTAKNQPVSQFRVEFSGLIDLSDADLGRVLRCTEGREMLLALAGASTKLIDKIYRQLPRADAQSLRRQIEQQGPIRLRDVEEAQRRIGLIAGRLAAAGEIDAPAARRFAVPRVMETV